MKNSKRINFLVAIIIASILLVSCAPKGSGTGVQVSWPGITVDEASSAAFASYSTQVYAINISNGTEKWRFPSEADKNVSFFAPGTLTSDGQLIVGGYNHTLYSLDAQTGKQIWKFDQSKDKYIAQPLVSDGYIYAPNNDGSLYALDTKGELIWTFETNEELWAMPLSDGEKVYLGSMGRHIYALDPLSGKQIWVSEDLGGAVVSAMSLDSDVIYAGTVGENLVAVSAANGKILWSAQLDGWVWTQPLFANESVFVADQEGIVYSLDAASGEISWQIQPDIEADRGIISNPVITEDALFFASQGGVLYAVDPETGVSKWNKVVGGHIYSDLHLANDLIVFGVSDFDSLVLGLDNKGNNRWAFIPAK